MDQGQPAVKTPAPTSPGGPRRFFWPFVLLIAVLQLVVSLAAVSGKSPTADEPLHIYAGWRSLAHFDLRFNPEHPPLWKYWAALPSLGLTLGPAEDEAYRRITGDVTQEWEPTVRDLYRVDPAQGLALIWRGRCMMALLACGLTVAAACLGRYLAGPLAGMLAAGVVGLDPNTLAHGPLVTNDIAITWMFVLILLLVSRMCIHLTWARGGMLALLLGIAMGVKFTAVLLGPIVAVCLLARSVVGSSWQVQGREIRSRLRRIAVALAAILVCAAGVFILLWASYGFRESVTPDGQRFSRYNFEQELRWFQTHARLYPTKPTQADLEAYEPGLLARLLLASDASRVLPNAWNFGMTYAIARSGIRSAYLLGEHNDQGWWYYFPLAMGFKAATASLLAMLAALVLVISLGRKGWDRLDERQRWAVMCIGVAVLIYAAQSMSGNLNIGFRHFFPVYYLLLILAAAVIARSAAGVRRAQWAPGVWLAGVLLTLVWTFPNYIAYFNLPSRAVGRPIDLLGDSNLDWGQDLPLIARWQRENPGVRVYLSYFGTCDPEVYGIKATPAYPQYHYGPPGEPITEPGVLIMSITRAQGLLMPELYRRSKVMRALPVREVLGGSVLVYDTDVLPPGIGQPP